MGESLGTMWESKDWARWDNAYNQETHEREGTNPDDLCSYGIRALDESLFKIGKNELVVIGADTGLGKSEMSLSIAQHNAANGKRVAVYFLEGGHLEAMRRMKWKDMTKKYYEDRSYSRRNIDFKEWVFNHNQDSTLSQIEGELKEEYKNLYKDNLFFYTTTKEFKVRDLLLSLMDFSETLSTDLNLDLIVIDHLQYFSFTGKESEIQQTTEILRHVKNITEYHNVPVILVSHLRKRGKNSGLPTHEDFHGSSNIAKISTTSILIAPAPEKDSLAHNIYPTYLRIAKSRVGVRPNYAMLVDFNLNKRKYEDEYKIYRVNEMGQVGENPLPENELPRWAKSATGGFSDDQRVGR